MGLVKNPETGKPHWIICVGLMKSQGFTQAEGKEQSRRWMWGQAEAGVLQGCQLSIVDSFW